jgi:hypothetical protein
MLPHRAFLSPHVSKFVMAAERLMLADVDPQAVPRTDLEAIQYYIQALSEIFLRVDTPGTYHSSASAVNGHQTSVE